MPDRAKKILIVYATAGSGHLRAAQAIEGYLSSNYKDLCVSSVDVLDYTNSIFKRLYSRGYFVLVTKFPFLWGWIYDFTYSRRLKRLKLGIVSFLNKIVAKKFKHLLIKDQPDIIISTHFFPSQVAASLKQQGAIEADLTTVITDFAFHPFWVSEGTDLYTVACGYTKEELIKFGVLAERIRVCGIPVDSKYSQNYQRQGVCKKLRIDDRLFTVTLTTSGFGLGPIKEIVDLLHNDFQLLIVCGRNKRLFDQLKAGSYQNVKIFPFVDNLNELMACSDLIISKPGGLTISEALAMELPFIFISPIPGQEMKNTEILANYGLGIVADTPKSLSRIVSGYRDNPAQLNEIKKRISMIKKPYAAKEIIDALR